MRVCMEAVLQRVLMREIGEGLSKVHAFVVWMDRAPQIHAQAMEYAKVIGTHSLAMVHAAAR